MKKENIFETDSPTLEMETQTYRTTQHGQPIPVVGGIPINPYTGMAINPASTPYTTQQGIGNFTGFTSPVTSPQYLVNPVTNQPHAPYPYGGSYMQPTMMGAVTPGYYGTPFPTPYNTNPYPGTWATIPTTPTPTPWNGTPFTTPVTGQWAGVPATQPNWGTVNPMQSGAYQPAINVADGQYMLVPNQYPQSASKNGTTYSRNGERDFVSWSPNVNILETDRAFKIEICVPGVTKENCTINVDKNNVLRVTGTRRWNQETDAVGFTRKEFNYGTFTCSFLLTDTLQKEKITSSCRAGLLIIGIPKREGSEGEIRSSSEISIN